MRPLALFGSCCVTCLVALSLTSVAEAARRPITGQLSKAGYTVIALAPSGQAAVARARGGRFRLIPPARSVTLQLRAPTGSYAGPVVVGRDGNRAIVGVKAGARLGSIRVRRGYARVARRLGAKADADLWARARRAVPIGARRFGRVRSRPGRPRVPGDTDRDGIPNVLDVDDDGDLRLDRVDPSGARSAARAAQDPEETFGFHSRLTLELPDPANANASGLTTEQVDAALAGHGDLLLTVLPSDNLPDSPELDCGGSIQEPPRPEGLIYCRPHESGGIGTVGRYPPRQSEVAFPDCCDLDEDGLGTLVADTSPLGTPSEALTLHHGSTTSQIGTGDVMIQTVTRGGVETSFLAALQYVFATVPALVSYDDDGAGGQDPTVVPYPFPGPQPGTGMGGGPGVRGNPAPVSDGPDADNDVELTVTFWRPQRSAVAAWGETGDWLDIGGLQYEVQVEESGRRCPQNAFTEDDPDLALSPSVHGNAGFRDLAGDRPPNRANTFTYTLNLTRCLEANGFTFNAGDARGFSFLATNPNGPDNAQQTVFFRRE